MRSYDQATNAKNKINTVIYVTRRLVTVRDRNIVSIEELARFYGPTSLLVRRFFHALMCVRHELIIFSSLDPYACSPISVP